MNHNGGIFFFIKVCCNRSTELVNTYKKSEIVMIEHSASYTSWDLEVNIQHV